MDEHHIGSPRFLCRLQGLANAVFYVRHYFVIADVRITLAKMQVYLIGRSQTEPNTIQLPIAFLLLHSSILSNLQVASASAELLGVVSLASITFRETYRSRRATWSVTTTDDVAGSAMLRGERACQMF